MTNQEKWLRVKGVLLSVLNEVEDLGYSFEKEEDFKSIPLKDAKVFVFRKKEMQLKFLFCPKGTNDLLSVCIVKSNKQTLFLTTYWAEKMEIDSSFFDLGNFQGTLEERVQGWLERILKLLEKDKKIQSILQGKGWVNFIHFWEKV